jgi:hypothetical protein
VKGSWSGCLGRTPPAAGTWGKSEEAGGGERGPGRLRPTCWLQTSGLSTTLAGCDAAYNGEAFVATASARAGPGRAFRRVLGANESLVGPWRHVSVTAAGHSPVLSTPEYAAQVQPAPSSTSAGGRRRRRG